MSLILLRHPKIHSAQGVCYGHTDCVPDVETFKSSISSATIALQALIQGGVAQWHSSPLLRCANFSAALAKSLSGSTPTHSDLLREMNFGAWENTAWECIAREQLDDWAKDPWHFKPGGVESVWKLLERWRAFKSQLKPSYNQGFSVVVTHAGIIRMALFEEKLITESAVWNYEVPYATPLVLRLN